MAEDLGVPLRVLDIDIEDQCLEADRIVEKYGDYVEDYLVPQVFLEYEDGQILHIFTGFSEGVAVSEAQWKNLFRNPRYKRLVATQKGDDNILREFAARYMSYHGRCRRHCSQQTSFIPLVSEDDIVLGSYTCPDNFVSSVVYMSSTPKQEWLIRFLQNQLGKEVFRRQDVRIATRHGWELGEEAHTELLKILPIGTRPAIEEVYWTWYPQTEDERTRGVTLCYDFKTEKGCKHLFLQDLRANERLCPQCRRV